jgi:hypothetical protein
MQLMIFLKGVADERTSRTSAEHERSHHDKHKLLGTRGHHVRSNVRVTGDLRPKAAQRRNAARRPR